MNLIPTLYHINHRLGYALLVVVLLPVVVAGQSLTKERLPQYSGRHGATLADTTRVRLLLEASAGAAAHVDRSTARDSALQFAKAALALSAEIDYDTGIYRAYLKEIAVWVHVRDRQLAQKQDASVALESQRAVQARFIAYVRKNGSFDQLGQAYTDVADLYDSLATDRTESVGLYDSAAACFRKGGNVVRESNSLYAVGYRYVGLGKPKEALPFFHRSIALVESIGGARLYSVYGLLGNTYSVLGGHNIGLKYGLKALQLAEAAGDTTGEIGALHLFLGLTYGRLKDYASARIHYEKAYRTLWHYSTIQPGDFFASAVNLAGMMNKTNPQESIDFLTRFSKEYKAVITPERAFMMTTRFMQAYARLPDYARAQTYCRQLMAEAEGTTRPSLAYMSISEFLVQSKQYAAAEKYLAAAEQILKGEGKIAYLPGIYLNWYKVDSAKRDYPAAIEKFKLHKAYGDSILNDTKTKEIALLEIEYETAKKEQSIALLTKDSELSRQQLAQSTFQKNAILVGLVVALLISVLLFHQYRSKRRNNIELSRRQQEIQTMNTLLQKTILEKEWLLKEVHHRVKNNLQTVVSLLGSQSYSLGNSEAGSAILESQNRVYAMSLIHQKLYQTEHRTSVNMDSYLGELTEYLRDSFHMGRMIQFQLDIQALELDVSQAIPIGLILN